MLNVLLIIIDVLWLIKAAITVDRSDSCKKFMLCRRVNTWLLICIFADLKTNISLFDHMHISIYGIKGRIVYIRYYL